MLWTVNPPLINRERKQSLKQTGESERIQMISAPELPTEKPAISQKLLLKIISMIIYWREEALVDQKNGIFEKLREFCEVSPIVNGSPINVSPLINSSLAVIREVLLPLPWIRVSAVRVEKDTDSREFNMIPGNLLIGQVLFVDKFHGRVEIEIKPATETDGELSKVIEKVIIKTDAQEIPEPLVDFIYGKKTKVVSFSDWPVLPKEQRLIHGSTIPEVITKRRFFVARKTGKGKNRIERPIFCRKNGTMFDVTKDLNKVYKELGSYRKITQKFSCSATTIYQYMSLNRLDRGFEPFVSFELSIRQRLGLPYATAIANLTAPAQKALLRSLKDILEEKFRVEVLRQMIRIICPESVPTWGLLSKERRNIKAKETAEELLKKYLEPLSKTS